MSCPDCFKGAIHEHGEPQGTIQQMYGYSTYITGQDGRFATNSTILYLPDAFGHRLINNKLLADRFAKDTGCRVLFPDILPNGGADVSIMAHMETVMKPAGFSPIKWFYRVTNLLMMVVKFVPFLITSGAPKLYPVVLKYARAIRADLPPDQGKLGVCGFCWGGYGATRLCVESAVENNKSTSNSNTTAGTAASGGKLIDAAFTAHPSFLKIPDMFVDAVANKVPYSCAVAESDMMVNAKAAEQVEATLRQKFGPPEQANYQFVVHKGCNHGFAVRAVPDNKLEVQGSEDAAVQAATWFNRFLK